MTATVLLSTAAERVVRSLGGPFHVAWLTTGSAATSVLSAVLSLSAASARPLTRDSLAAERRAIFDLLPSWVRVCGVAVGRAHSSPQPAADLASEIRQLLLSGGDELELDLVLVVSPLADGSSNSTTATATATIEAFTFGSSSGGSNSQQSNAAIDVHDGAAQIAAMQHQRALLRVSTTLHAPLFGLDLVAALEAATDDLTARLRQHALLYSAANMQLLASSSDAPLEALFAAPPAAAATASSSSKKKGAVVDGSSSTAASASIQQASATTPLELTLLADADSDSAGAVVPPVLQYSQLDSIAYRTIPFHIDVLTLEGLDQPIGHVAARLIEQITSQIERLSRRYATLLGTAASTQVRADLTISIGAISSD